MTLTNPRATFGLNATATPTKSGSSGALTIGDRNESSSLPLATKIVSFDAVIVGSASNLTIDVSDLDNTGSTAWTAGAAQVETATAAGTVSGSGNASVVVTSSGMTGSPITLAVAVLATDTATAWATKVRTALNANAVIAARFTVGGSTTAISLTRKATSTYTINGVSVPVYAANDATLNLSLDNGTCTGITTAATSTNTTSGVLTAGAYAPDLDGTDFEGEATAGISSLRGLFIKVSSDCQTAALITQGSVLTDYSLSFGGILQVGGNVASISSADIMIEPASGGGDNSLFVTVTLAGS